MAHDQDTYDRLEIPALTSILLNPDSPVEAHRGALSALSRQDQLHRISSLIQVLKSISRHPGRYDLDVMMNVIDLLATEPDADATVAFIEVLPAILETGITGRNELKPEFREYYYAALLTRQREDDLEVWAEMLPQLESKSLAAILLDPVAGSLVEAIDPLTLIERLAEPEKSAALFRVVTGVIMLKGKTEYLQQSVVTLRKSSDQGQLEKGLATLTQLYEQAKKAGQQGTVNIIAKVLGALDRRPRTAGEKLMGKRPWAP